MEDGHKSFNNRRITSNKDMLKWIKNQHVLLETSSKNITSPESLENIEWRKEILEEIENLVRKKNRLDIIARDIKMRKAGSKYPYFDPENEDFPAFPTNFVSCSCPAVKPTVDTTLSSISTDVENKLPRTLAGHQSLPSYFASSENLAYETTRPSSNVTAKKPLARSSLENVALKSLSIHTQVRYKSIPSLADQLGENIELIQTNAVDSKSTNTIEKKTQRIQTPAEYFQTLEQSLPTSQRSDKKISGTAILDDHLLQTKSNQTQSTISLDGKLTSENISYSVESSAQHTPSTNNSEHEKYHSLSSIPSIGFPVKVSQSVQATPEYKSVYINTTSSLDLYNKKTRSSATVALQKSNTSVKSQTTTPSKTFTNQSVQPVQSLSVELKKLTFPSDEIIKISSRSNLGSRTHSHTSTQHAPVIIANKSSSANFKQGTDRYTQTSATDKHLVMISKSIQTSINQSDDKLSKFVKDFTNSVSRASMISLKHAMTRSTQTSATVEKVLMLSKSVQISPSQIPSTNPPLPISQSNRIISSIQDLLKSENNSSEKSIKHAVTISTQTSIIDQKPPMLSKSAQTSLNQLLPNTTSAQASEIILTSEPAQLSLNKTDSNKSAANVFQVKPAGTNSFTPLPSNTLITRNSSSLTPKSVLSKYTQTSLQLIKKTCDKSTQVEPHFKTCRCSKTKNESKELLPSWIPINADAEEIKNSEELHQTPMLTSELHKENVYLAQLDTPQFDNLIENKLFNKLNLNKIQVENPKKALQLKNERENQSSMSIKSYPGKQLNSKDFKEYTHSPQPQKVIKPATIMPFSKIKSKQSTESLQSKKSIKESQFPNEPGLSQNSKELDRAKQSKKLINSLLCLKKSNSGLSKQFNEEKQSKEFVNSQAQKAKQPGKSILCAKTRRSINSTPSGKDSKLSPTPKASKISRESQTSIKPHLLDAERQKHNKEQSRTIPETSQKHAKILKKPKVSVSSQLSVKSSQASQSMDSMTPSENILMLKNPSSDEVSSYILSVHDLEDNKVNN